MTSSAMIAVAAGAPASSAGGFDIDIGATLLAGVLATVALTVLMSAAQALRWSRMSLPLMIGTVFRVGRELSLIAGMVLHTIGGWVSAFIYAAFFEVWGTSVWFGALLGASHALFVLAVLLPISPGFHPGLASARQGPSPTRSLQPPGFMGLNYGVGSAVATFVAHVAYGVILGAMYPS